MTTLSHHATYQYVVVSDNQVLCNHACECERLLAVFAATAQVEYVILSVTAVAEAPLLEPHAKYQYVAVTAPLGTVTVFIVEILAFVLVL